MTPRIPFPMLGPVPEADTDDALLAALRAGDASAVAPFIDRFYGIAFHVAARFSHDADTCAWDALSDLAVALLQGRHRHVRLTHPAAYIATAVTNRVYQASRAAWRFRKRLSKLATMEEAGVGQAVSEATYRAARGGPWDVGETAPPTPLPSFLTGPELDMMTWVGDGWTQQEIADELHIERDAAKKRIKRLKRRIQRNHAIM